VQMAMGTLGDTLAACSKSAVERRNFEGTTTTIASAALITFGNDDDATIDSES